MIELQGKYNKAKVFSDIIDNGTVGQITGLLNQKSLEDSQIRIMPDHHQGKGCVIGTTMTITDKVIPNLVGVDIGCGMALKALKDKRIDLPKLDSYIRKNVPSGFDVRERSARHKYWNDVDLEELRCAHCVDIERAYNSLGTLGGGNHFIEVDKDDSGKLYLVIHTGSRNLGKQVAQHYQDMAWDKIKKGNRADLIQQKIKELTEAGKQQEIEEAIKNIKSTVDAVPHELAYCEGQLFDDYIHDMKIVQRFAYLNREAIADTIIKGLNLKEIKNESFQTIHNYIDTDNMILRKGAISCQKGERVIIPINMRDGSLICIGKGNPDWNYSGPHGAGRLHSRSQAKQLFTVSQFKKTMDEAGIFTTSVGKDTLDESPMAYKSMDEIKQNIQDTAEIINEIKPIYNFKAGGD